MAIEKQKAELLNEIGQNLLNVKRVLIENKNNPFIHNGLLQTLNKQTIGEEIYGKLIDDQVDLDTFSNSLIAYDKYGNKEYISLMLKEFKTYLSKRLEMSGVKHFVTTSSAEEGIVVVRKFGISLDRIQRTFRLTEDEALKLIETGFVKQYSTLLLKAFGKDISQKISKKVNLLKEVSIETTSIYFNEKYNMYNIDLRIVIKLSEKQLTKKRNNNNALSFEGKLVKNCNEILSFAESEYFRTIKS